jgi:hypothetical protein
MRPGCANMLEAYKPQTTPAEFDPADLSFHEKGVAGVIFNFSSFITIYCSRLVNIDNKLSR